MRLIEVCEGGGLSVAPVRAGGREANPFTMSLPLLLLLLVGSSHASHFLGTVMTYHPKNTFSDGSAQVVVRYKSNFHTCQRLAWSCHSGNCGTESLIQTTVDMENTDSEWCQTEVKSTRLVPSNAPFQLSVNGGNWISNIKNNITLWRAVTTVELRNRSDTGKANTSPQTTVIPAVRVPSNCQRDFNLLTFDPDGDEVRCRNGIAALDECNPCTPPAVLSLSSSCTMSFTPTTSSNEGPYAVQLVMEDFPGQSIILTHTNVDPAASSCTDGVYLPRFLSPTPAHRTQLYVPADQSLEISIKAEANSSNITELLFSGPSSMSESTPAAGEYVLRWTPSSDEDGESHPVCFVVQSDTADGRKYHSELRCVIVTVGQGQSTLHSPNSNSTHNYNHSNSNSTHNYNHSNYNSTHNYNHSNYNSTHNYNHSNHNHSNYNYSNYNYNHSNYNYNHSNSNYNHSNTTTTTPTPTTTTTTPTTTTTTPTTTTPTTTTTTPTTTTPTTTTPTTTTTTTTPTTTTPTTTTTTPTTTTTTTTTTPTTTTTTPTTTTTTPTPTTTTPTTTPTTTTPTTTTPTTTTPSTTTPTTTTPTTTTPSTTTPSTTTPPATTTDSAPANSTDQIVLGLRIRITSSVPLSDDDIRNTVVQQLKEELIKQGLPADSTLRLLSSTSLNTTVT
ncbi:hypothetical protein INR49_008768 [Caranx melampygus]|nr:hypothetical protein INR49_008768 [Caranx melampygus]